MRVLAVVIGLLLVSSLGSVLLLRAALFDALDDEVEESVTREAPMGDTDRQCEVAPDPPP